MSDQPTAKRPTSPERRDQLIATYTEELFRDLTYAAPEMWRIRIRETMQELADDLDQDTEPAWTCGYVHMSEDGSRSKCLLPEGHDGNHYLGQPLKDHGTDTVYQPQQRRDGPWAPR